MNGIRQSPSLLLLIVLLLLPPLAARGQDAVAPRHNSPQTDEAELRALVSRYAAAFASNDQKELAEVVAFEDNRWHTDVAERDDAWQSALASSTRVALLGFKVERVVLGETEEGRALFGGDDRQLILGGPLKRKLRAAVFLTLNIRAFDAKTGQPRTELLDMHRVVECAKLRPYFRFGERGIKRTFSDISYEERESVWLVVGDEPDLKKLSADVLAAKTERDARAYLTLENEAALHRLSDEIEDEAAKNFEQEKYERGLRALRTARVVEEEIKSKRQETAKLREQYKSERALQNIAAAEKSLAESRAHVAELKAMTLEERLALKSRVRPPPDLDLKDAPDEEQAPQPVMDTLSFYEGEIPSDLQRIASLYSEAGRQEEALKLYEQSFKEYERLGNKRMMADVLEGVGRLCLKQNDETRALDYWLRSYVLGEEGLAELDAAVASGKVAIDDGGYYFEYKDGVPSKAVGQFNNAYRGHYMRDNLARLLDDVAELYLKQKNYEQAIAFYRNSAGQYKLLVARTDEARKREEAEKTSAGAKKEAKGASGVKGVAVSSESFWLGAWARELGRIAEVYKTLGQRAKAVEAYEQAAEELKAAGKRDAAADMYLSMALFSEQYEKAGHIEEAVGLCERSLARLKEMGEESKAGMLYFFLSLYYIQANNQERAEASVEKALAALPSLEGEEEGEDDDTPPLAAYFFWARALIFELQGNYDDALKEYQRARALSYKPSSEKLMHFLLGMIPATVYLNQGNEAVGMEMMRDAMPLKTLLDASKGLPDMLNHVCVYYTMTGNDALSERCFGDALRFAEEAGAEKEAAESLSYLADIYAERKDYERAVSLLERKLGIEGKGSEREEHARTLTRIGGLYREQKLYARALEYYERGLAVVDGGDRSAGVYMNDLAETYLLLGEEEKALAAAERSMAAARRIGDRDALWHARSIAGRALLALGRTREASAALDEAINAIEFIRVHLAGDAQQRQFFLEDKIAPYQAMIELLVKEGRDDDALYYAERSKARELLDVMQFGRLNPYESLMGEERAADARLLGHMNALGVEMRQEQQRERADESKLERLRREIRRARLEYETFHAEVYARSPQPEGPPAAAEPVKADEASALLPGDDGAILEFVVTPARSYLFVLTSAPPTGVQSASPRPQWKSYAIEVTADELAARVHHYLGAIAPADASQRSNYFKDEARELYKLLLGPAQAQLSGKSSFVVVPDGVLWNLPFQTLQTPAGRFLIEEGAVSYAPSLSVLREMRRLRDERVASGAGATHEFAGLLLALGDPELGVRARAASHSARRNRLEPLPETAEEVKSAAALYGAPRAKYLVGPDATEENFKRLAADYKILHLATHGLVNNEQPMYSQIVLARPRAEAGARPSEDGYLEAREIVRLKLSADLVILSACETALGRVGNGEGMIGLTWSLSAAGTPTVVASQWAVNSCSTTELMLEFHRQLKGRMTGEATGVGAAEALRQAVLRFIHPDDAPRKGSPGACGLPNGDSRHPYFWAGFIVIGDGR